MTSKANFKSTKLPTTETKINVLEKFLLHTRLQVADNRTLYTICVNNLVQNKNLCKIIKQQNKIQFLSTYYQNTANPYFHYCTLLLLGVQDTDKTTINLP